MLAERDFVGTGEGPGDRGQERQRRKDIADHGDDCIWDSKSTRCSVGFETDARRSGQFQPPQLDTIRMNVGQVVLSLLDKPAFGAAAEYLLKAHGHFRRYAPLLVHQFGKRRARHAEGRGGVRDAQSQRLDALAEYEAAGVRWVLHRPGSSLLSVVVQIINVECFMRV